ncbi:tetratricopeptide repeat protein [Asanoa sp. NPDC049573]|uniref:ATP-binding protein n=1 Tax=Asanoa sp. NPDC049573 TaxID=3155396 RepID=UPI00341579AF
MSGAAPAPIVVISGPGGAGKTWLALRWAYDHLDDFPDGAMHLSLRGFDPGGQPVTVEAATRTLLQSLGVAPAAIPTDCDARVALYRSLLAGRRMVLVLDDARDAAQVRSLLPGTSSCTVLVTSRRPLQGLAISAGATAFPLPLLDDAAAEAILTGEAPEGSTRAEHAALTALISWCGGLPLALGIIAARLRGPSAPSPTALADELRDASLRLDALATDDLDTNLRTVIGCSFRALSGTAARLFALIGLVPFDELGVDAASALLGTGHTGTLAALRELVTINLADEPRPHRFRMHDLVRLYANECADTLPAEEAGAARLRLVRYYTLTAYAAERLLDPRRPAITAPRALPGVVPTPLTDEHAASRWLDLEHRNVGAVQAIAAGDGQPLTAIQLGWSLVNYHRTHGQRQAQVDLWRTGLRAAVQLGGPTEQALAHRYLGHALAGVERYAEATTHLDEALSRFDGLGDVTALAHTHHAYSWVRGQQGDDRSALEHAEQALALFKKLHDPSWTADALNSAGWYHAQLGRLDRAQDYAESALRISRHIGYREGEAYTLDTIAFLALRRGDNAGAACHYEQALAVFIELDNLVMQADALGQLADAYEALGRGAAARCARHEADRLGVVLGRGARVDRQVDEADPLDEEAAHAPDGTSPA